MAESNLVLDAVLRKTSLIGEDFTLERAAGEGEEGGGGVIQSFA